MLKNLLLSIATLVVMLLAGEAVLAVAGRFSPSPRLYPGDKPVGTYAHQDPWIGWKLPPASAVRSAPSHGDFDVTYRANQRGFRARPGAGSGAGAEGHGANGGSASEAGLMDREASAPLPDGAGEAGSGGPPPPAGARRELRIAFLGDSFTFGVGVESDETFVHQVERRLPGARAFNFGMSGFGIGQMWLTLRHYAARVEPDIVVLSFILDDLNRTMAAYRLRDTLQHRRSRGEIGWVPKPAFDLDDDGGLVRLGADDAPPALVRLLRERSRILEGARRVGNRLSLRFPIGRRWRLNRRIFEEIRDEAARLGAELLVVYIPSKGWEERPIPVFEAEFAEMGIAYLDLRARLPADPSGLYFEHDGHFDATGHAFAAERIVETLRELGWTR